MSKLKDQTQRDQAILEKERDVTVMAGAGTGKTELLSERYIELVAPRNDSDKALSVERVAAITFTRRAAGEIKNRIRSKLLNLKNTDLTEIRRARVEEAISKLDSALMGTIHSFSDKLLGLRPIEAKISPIYEVVEDEGEILLETSRRLVEGARTDTLKDQWTDHRFLPSDDLLNKTKDFFNNLRQSGIRLDDVQRGYQTDPGFISFISSCVKNRDKKAPIKMTVPPFDVEENNRLLEELHADMIAALQDDNGTKGFNAIRSRLGRVGYAIKAKTLGNRARQLSRIFNFPAYKKGDDFGGSAAGYEIRKGLTGEYSKTTKQYRDDILVPVSEALMAPLPEIYPVILSIYEDVKRRHEVVDQMDLLIKLRDVLKLPHVKSYYQSLFDHIFVDEFQDTDPIQAEIVLDLCEIKGSLTIIGDPKQSIYRFRRADISEFARVVDVLKDRGALESRLSVNFRSKSGLIEEFNNAFGAYLGEVKTGEPEFLADTGEVCYSPLEAIHGPAEMPSVRFLQLDAGGLGGSNGGRDLDVVLMARYIAKIVSGEGDLKAKPSEIAVLTRAMTNVGPLMVELKKLGLEVYVSGGTTFGESEVVQKFITLLSLVSRDNAAGLALLHSYEVSDVGPKEILENDEDEISTYQWLKELRMKKNSRPVMETALEVLEGSSYGKILSLGTNGDDDLANIYRFINLFSDHAENQGLGFDHAIDWALEWLENPPRMSSPLRSGDNAIKILSIHQSKGLEFPITILFDSFAGDGMFRKGSLMTSVDGKQWYANIGVYEAQYPKGSSTLIDREEIHHRNEQKRLQYVACTRAENYLIIPVVNPSSPRWQVYARIWEEVKNSGSENVHLYPVSKYLEDRDFLQPYELTPEFVKPVVDNSIDESWKKLDLKLDEMVLSAKKSKWSPTSPTMMKDKESEVTWEVMDVETGEIAKSGGADLGNQIHEVLFYHLVKGVDLNTALENYGRSNDQVAQHVGNALKVLNEVGVDGWQILGEVPFSLHLKDDGRLMTGLIDLLLVKDNEFHIIDYKS
ncbi:MAG: hypothetical protein EP319_11900, partial [Deltaproteobacteria bacterium]